MEAWATSVRLSTATEKPEYFVTTHAFPESLPESRTTRDGAAAAQMPGTSGGRASEREGAVAVATSPATLGSAHATTAASDASSDSTNSTLRSAPSSSFAPAVTKPSTTEAMTASTMRPTKKARFFDNIRSTIKQLTSTGGGGFTRQLLEADISADCVLGLLQFMRAFRELEPWALRLFDATAKYPTGFLQATSAELGAYDECIETVVRDEDGAEKVRGQYCNMRLSITDEDSFLEEILPAIAFTHRRASKFGSYFVDKKLPGLRLGLCFVSSCSAQDLTNIAQTMAGNRAKIVVDNCVTSVDDGISGTQAGIIAYLAILAMVIVAATGLDLLTERWDKNRKNAIPYKCAMAFSALSNSRLIMGINKDKNSDNYSFRFMHGIRFLSIFWICLGHSYGTISENFSRMLNAVQYFERWETLIVTAGYLAVDTFFFLSGFLLNYTLSRQHRNRAVVTVVAIIRRYVRITVPLFFMLMCMYLLPLIASGPNSKDLYNRFYAEIRKHWWDLLFLMRNWRADQEVTILPHLWYLSIDYQLFLVGVVVIQVLKT
ncbi:hypothetical protein V5799_024760 [Amblyomma americanum]|uniref:Nose resistant-to-fluoxetine protein N-terminal domain-containing protein n=1 Tax=Amblyomma americanum TaxID=6943 RepID=A0AAQ4EBE2_AMBAM